jgi:protein involved in polysaccharide export with SLBB domain
MYDLKPGWRVIDLVAMAGGLNARPSRVMGRVIRGSSRVIPLHMAQAVSDPGSDANPPLEPDDLVLLEEMEPVKNQVHVMGQVDKPGAYELESGMSVLSLLSTAGNPTDRAALSRAYVLRGQTEMPLNLRGLLMEGKPDPAILHFKLQTGDVLFIPEIQAQYAVMGHVQRPGYYPVPEQGRVTVSRAIILAGGQNADGDLGRVGVVRPAEGRYRIIPVNVTTIMKRGDLAADIPLQAEDIVFIPPRSRPFEWQSVVGPLSTLSILGVRFFR